MLRAIISILAVSSFTYAADNYFPTTIGNAYYYTFKSLTPKDSGDGFDTSLQDIKRLKFASDTTVNGIKYVKRSSEFLFEDNSSSEDASDYFFVHNGIIKRIPHATANLLDTLNGIYFAHASFKIGEKLEDSSVTAQYQKTWNSYSVIDNGTYSVPAGKYENTIAVVHSLTSIDYNDNDSITNKSIENHTHIFANNIGLIATTMYTKSLLTNKYTYYEISSLDSCILSTTNANYTFSNKAKHSDYFKLSNDGFTIKSIDNNAVMVSIYNNAGQLLTRKSINPDSYTSFQSIGLRTNGNYIFSFGNMSFKRTLMPLNK